ncbi:Uncharacterized protein ACMD2_18597 [Ananas comosus]|uniref:Small EDRK-rich factor-like N-terminal domain-containing protein n=1 Tax=Ananas comosus TaxID=4615 RepID=A0A199VIE3_ANACO|nr:Uncharacterized protein ACMD2_18597 [Ananas comosus]
MGGGNGQKSKMARDKHMEKNKPPKGSQLESNKKAMTIQSSKLRALSYISGAARQMRWLSIPTIA